LFDIMNFFVSFIVMQHTRNKKVTSSLEDYLEAILQLDEDSGRARAVDVAEKLGVGKPSVTAALKTLSGKGLVDYKPYKPAALTVEGRRIARSVRKKHVELKSFLAGTLGMEEKQAELEACRLEHTVSKETIVRLRLLEDYAKNTSRKIKQWFSDFRKKAGEYIRQEEIPDEKTK